MNYSIRLITILLIAAHLLLNGCASSSIKEPIRKVDKFFQDFASSVRHTTKKISGEPPPAKKQSNADPQNKPVFTIQKFTLTPAKVKHGDQVRLTLQYVVMGTSSAGLKITEKNTLSLDGKELTVLKEATSVKENGIWESALTFTVPESAKPGEYIVRQELSAQGLFRSSRRTFTLQ